MLQTYCPATDLERCGYAALDAGMLQQSAGHSAPGAS